jgi:hypothetical protein
VAPQVTEAPVVIAPAPVLSEREQALQALRVTLTGEAPPAPLEVPEAVETWAKTAGYTKDDLLAIPTLRKEVAEGREAAQKVEQWDALIKSLPPSFRVAMDQAARGEAGWKKTISETHDDVDFTKPFEKQSIDDMRTRFSGLDADTLQAAKDGDPTALKAVAIGDQLAKREFNTLKGTYDGHFAQRQEAEQQREQRFLASRDTAINELQRTMPGVGALIPEIKQGLTYDNVVGLFFAQDGTLRPDAATLYAVAKYRQELFDSKVQKVTKQAKDAAELAVLDRTPERIEKSLKTEIKNVPPKAPAQLAEEHLNRWMSGVDLVKPRN